MNTQAGQLKVKQVNLFLGIDRKERKMKKAVKDWKLTGPNYQ